MSAEPSNAPVLPPALAPDLDVYCAMCAVHYAGGCGELGLVVQGHLAGIRLALVRFVGPEAAYAMLQRAADEAASEIVRNGWGG